MAETPVKKTSPGEFIRQVRAEANKVVWPTILAVFFLGVDSLFGEVVRLLLKLA
jgi:preprotein translocase subunit SecE